MATALLGFETIDADQIDDIMHYRPPRLPWFVAGWYRVGADRAPRRGRSAAGHARLTLP
jgi:hypothetical protein